MGPDATGYISYSDDGYVFVHIMKKDRENYTVNDPFVGTAEEDAAAVKSSISYAGPFTINGGEITHHVTHSSFPNWVGSKQIRSARFEGSTLVLSAAGATFQGKEVTAYVTWERAS